MNTAVHLTRLKLTSIKTVAWMSEETTCFTAAVQLDGIRIGDASNDGKGGSTLVRFTDIDARNKATEFAKTVHPADIVGWEWLDEGFMFEDLVDIVLHRQLTIARVTQTA